MAEEQDLHAPVSKWKMPVGVFFKDARRVFKWDILGKEILDIALPAALATAADPIASLIDTAFIGHIGPVELAAAGVSIALFNQASRITVFPLVSITTSFVAEEDTVAKMNIKSEKGEQLQKADMLDDLERGAAKPNGTAKENGKHLGNGKMEEASDEDDEHVVAGKGAPEAKGESSDNGLPESSEAKKAIAENVKLEKAEKGAAKNSNPLENGSRTIKKEKITKQKRHIASASTALIFGTILGLLQTIFLIFSTKVLLGVMGVKSLWDMELTLPWIHCSSLSVAWASEVQLWHMFFLSTLLLARVVAVTFCVTLAASLAAREGPTPMAAFQTCLQVWLTSSLLADGLAVAGQAILACAFAEKDYKKAIATATRVLQMSFILGVGLTFVVGIGLYFGAGIFSSDVNVLHLIRIGLPVLVAIASIVSLFLLSKSHGFIGIWIALTVYMVLRTFAGVWR
ncbi:hypothetical protein ACE6H2_006012 [Prunus campanulata]